MTGRMGSPCVKRAGGALGESYAVTFNFTLNTGEVDERSINIFIHDR